MRARGDETFGDFVSGGGEFDEVVNWITREEQFYFYISATNGGQIELTDSVDRIQTVLEDGNLISSVLTY